VNQTNTVFRACSGAVVANLRTTAQEHDGVPDQNGIQAPDSVLGPDVSLITLTMGGNDLDFAKALEFCFKKKNCQDRPYEGEPTLSIWVAGQLKILKGSLLTAYQDLRAGAKNARIVVLGYPALFPENAPRLWDPRYKLCNIYFTRWTRPERAAIRTWGVELDDVIQEDAHQAGIEYVDTYALFAGHEPCGSSGQWVRAIGIGSKPIRDGSFHPTQDGQAMFARIVSCYLAIYAPGNNGGTQEQDYAMSGCAAGATNPQA
jgi:hypothetical protein